MLLTIDEEFVECPLSQSGQIKDGIRQYAVSDLLSLFQQALANCQAFDEQTVNEALLVVSQLIDWNALELFASMVPMLQGFLAAKAVRRNALMCLHAIVHKGMDYPAKVELIVNIQYVEILESFMGDQIYDDELLFTTIAETINKLG